MVAVEARLHLGAKHKTRRRPLVLRETDDLQFHEERNFRNAFGMEALEALPDLCTNIVILKRPSVSKKISFSLFHEDNIDFLRIDVISRRLSIPMEKSSV